MLYVEHGPCIYLDDDAHHYGNKGCNKGSREGGLWARSGQAPIPSFHPLFAVGSLTEFEHMMVGLVNQRCFCALSKRAYPGSGTKILLFHQPNHPPQIEALWLCSLHCACGAALISTTAPSSTALPASFLPQTILRVALPRQLSPQKILDSRARASDSYLSGCLQSSWINAVGGEMSVRHWPTICSPSLSIFPCQEIICVAEHMNRIPMAISWENREY